MEKIDIDPLEYTMPENRWEADIIWNLPLLCSYLSCKDFFFLYSALLLEKTVVF